MQNFNFFTVTDCSHYFPSHINEPDVFDYRELIEELQAYQFNGTQFQKQKYINTAIENFKNSKMILLSSFYRPHGCCAPYIYCSGKNDVSDIYIKSFYEIKYDFTPDIVNVLHVTPRVHDSIVEETEN